VSRRTSPLVFFLLWLVATPACAALEQIHEVHYQMGTFLEFRLWHHDPDTARNLIRAAVKEVHRLNRILSNYDPESALSRFNQAAGNGRMALPPELFEVLHMSQSWSIATDGYFDVTVGPLMQLWRRSAELGHVPRAAELRQAAALVGYSKLSLYSNGEAALERHGMEIDLGGIGKGYAVDRMAAQLKAAGVSSALINFGSSSIYGIGAPPRAKGWEVGIQGPDGRIPCVVYLRGAALSTSGSMGRSWKIANKSYGHMLDPKSGRPVTERRVATVIGPSAAGAEALTKPLALIGQAGLGLASGFPETAALIIPAAGGLSFSSEFRRHATRQECPRL
jgi:thiamine biosynthesis lipoprotein